MDTRRAAASSGREHSACGRCTRATCQGSGCSSYTVAEDAAVYRWLWSLHRQDQSRCQHYGRFRRLHLAAVQLKGACESVDRHWGCGKCAELRRTEWSGQQRQRRRITSGFSARETIEHFLNGGGTAAVCELTMCCRSLREWRYLHGVRAAGHMRLQSWL